MYHPIVLYISLRYMLCWHKYNRFRHFISFLSVIGISLGVMALITVLSVMNGFERELENNILGLIPQALLTSNKGSLNPNCISVSLLNSLKHVIRKTPLTTSDVIINSAHGIAMGTFLGVNPTNYEPLFNYLIGVRQNELIAGQYRVILGNELANLLGVKRGDFVRLIVPSVNQFTLIGRIPSQRLFTVIGTFITNNEVDSYQLLLNQQDASHLMHYPLGHVTGCRLWMLHPQEINKLESQLSELDNIVLHDWRDSKGELFHAIHIEKNIMCLLFSIIVAVAIFNIITSLGLLVTEKKHEIAILQTQGLTSWRIMLIFIIYGACIGIVGSFLGVFFGILLVNQLQYITLFVKLFFDGILVPVFVNPMQVIFIILSTILFAILSTIYPAWYVFSIQPVKVLRYE